jgi:HK97 family phage major capsid protein
MKTEYRSSILDSPMIDSEKRTVELSFSSEAPVERAFGYEILDHAPSSIRLGRLQPKGPVLVDHNPSDPVGVIETISLDPDKKARARIRFGNSLRAQEVFQDVVDGIRHQVSVGYRIHQVKQQDATTVRVMDWEPLEISFVSLPADITVGVGRTSTSSFNLKETPMETENTIPLEQITHQTREAETTRLRELAQLGSQFNQSQLASEYIERGDSVSDFKEILLKNLSSKPLSPQTESSLGLSEMEVKRFSFVKAFNALANPSNPKAQKEAAFEIEVSRATAQKLGREPQGIMVPPDVLKRGLTTGNSESTIGLDFMAQSFIEMLRNRAVVLPKVTLLSGLSSPVKIPRQSGGATAYWLKEGQAPENSNQSFDQVALTPKTLGAYTDITRKLLLENSIDVENLVRRDLATTLAQEIDRVIINGSGKDNEPLGILNLPDMGLITLGANGGALSWKQVVQLETEIAADNADIGQLYYITHARVRGQLKQTEKAANTAQFLMQESALLNGYQTLISNQVPSNLAKGTAKNLSALIFANLSDVLVGMWGGLDLTVDPYSMSTSGTIRLVALQDIDIAFRHLESFAAIKDIAI